MNNNASYIGQSIERYTFNELIGKGSISQIYKAFDNKLLRPVAIKAYNQSIDKVTTQLQRVIREAQIIARVEHANIIPIYDVIDYEQSALIVMRLLHGEDLDKLTHRSKTTLTMQEAFKIMHQAMLGIDFAHKKGVVHSDLKPGNIFISSSDEIFILDFGLAAVLELEKLDNSKLYGTPLYMSPEQIKGKYIDARTDIYSIGMILYTLITGSHPFADAASLKELLSCQIEKVPMRPDKINPAISEKFSDCVMKALEKNPRKRYYSCRDLANDLELTLPENTIEAYRTHELRWDPRADVNLKARIKLSSSSEWIDVKITSLSANGAKMLVPCSPMIGSKINVVMDVLEDENVVNIPCEATILWKDRSDSGQLIQVGVSFDNIEDMDKQCISLFVRNILLE